MKPTIVCLLCVSLVIMTQLSMTNGSPDDLLSRSKRGLFDNILDGLVKKFSQTVGDIFNLNPEDFENVLRSLGRISKSLAKNILEKFKDLQDSQQDFGSQENYDRIAQMMKTLEDVEQRDDTSSGTAMLTVSFSLPLSLLVGLVTRV